MYGIHVLSKSINCNGIKFLQHHCEFRRKVGIILMQSIELVKLFFVFYFS